jgi:hypothetical protein
MLWYIRLVSVFFFVEQEKTVARRKMAPAAMMILRYEFRPGTVLRINTAALINLVKSDFERPQQPVVITMFFPKYFILTLIFIKRTGRAKVKNIPDPRNFPIFAG